MSDTSQGDGWWQASDGKFYPPEASPATEATEPAGADTPTEAVSTSDPAGDPTAAVPAAGAAAGASASVFSDEAADTDPTTAVPATAATPPIPPGDDPSASDGGDDDGNSKKKIIGAIVAVIALAAAAFAFFALTADDEAAAGEVVLEAVGDAGPAPFTDPVAAVDSKVLKWAEEGPPANVAPATSAGPEGYQATDGNVPGVFGGSLSEGSCERDQLVSFLASNEAKASAWAGVLDIDAADIGGFVAGLTPINTSTDVRVVTHGFADDEVVPREAVLQRGTAVLSDAQGIPRVNCYSGNPLTAASVNADEEFSGDPWPAFQQTNVVIINQAPADLSEFELIELTTGELFKRPVGTAGESDKVDGPPTEDVPNDGPIEFDTLIEDTLTESRTEAIYTMDVPDSAILTLTAANQRESIGSVRFLLTKSGDRFSDLSLAPGADDSDVIVISADGGGPFELSVTGGPAAFSFTVGLGSQNDAGSGKDAGADLAASLTIDPGSFSGETGGIDTADVYEVALVPGSNASFSLANGRESEGTVRMIASLEGDRLFDVSVSPGGSEDGSTLLSGTDEGTVLIEITTGSNRTFYDVEATFTKQTDTDADGDAGDDLASATTVGNPSTVAGEVGERDVGDFYLFAPPAAATIEMSSASTSTGTMRVIVTDASGARMADFSLAPGATDRAEFVGVPGQQFRLEITGGRASYTGGIT
ncbi:MAG TPA: DUF6777 domain-containing protein [Acidimicrobiales bacterium]|nr:DUF6777 domain-containing protein [Acidimicrobiales bacterium]